MTGVDHYLFVNPSVSSSYGLSFPLNPQKATGKRGSHSSQMCEPLCDSQKLNFVCACPSTHTRAKRGANLVLILESGETLHLSCCQMSPVVLMPLLSVRSDAAPLLLPKVARGADAIAVKGERARRDVKPSNILLTEDGRAKVSDMGLSRAEFFSSSNGFAGTFMYAAPEVLLGRPSNEKVHNCGENWVSDRGRACR